MKVAVYSRTFDQGFLPCIKDFFHYLNEYRFEVYVFEEFVRFLEDHFSYRPDFHGTFTGYQDIRNDMDFVTSIGGDGTFLDTLSLVRNTGIPVIGINSGKLGFLASISKDDIKQAVSSIYHGNYTIEERSLLKIESDPQLFEGFSYALNDVTIQKKGSEMKIGRAHV